MFKAVYQVYSQLRNLYDPSMEGTPYDSKREGFALKTKSTPRYHMSKVTKQLIVR